MSLNNYGAFDACEVLRAACDLAGVGVWVELLGAGPSEQAHFSRMINDASFLRSPAPIAELQVHFLSEHSPSPSSRDSCRFQEWVAERMLIARCPQPLPGFAPPSVIRFLDRINLKMHVFRTQSLQEDNIWVLKGELFPLLLSIHSERGALVLHAAGVSIGSGGLLVPGVSGAGKSTLSSFLGGRVLSDDVVVVKGLGGDNPCLVSTPLGKASDGLATAPLKAILFPCKSSQSFLNPVPRHVALAKLLAIMGPQIEAMPSLSQSTERLVRSLIASLATQVPAFEIHFQKGGPTADVLGEVHQLAEPRRR